MTPESKAAALARCDAEIAEIQARGQGVTAWLTVLGIEDWEAEKRAIEREDAK